jgi:hypothetical protein
MLPAAAASPCQESLAEAAPRPLFKPPLPDCAGAVDEAALLIELGGAPGRPWTLEQLGWAEAVAEAVSAFSFRCCEPCCRCFCSAGGRGRGAAAPTFCIPLGKPCVYHQRLPRRAPAVRLQARNYWWLHCSNPESCLEPLLALWRRQRRGGSPATAPTPQACHSIVAALLDHASLDLTSGKVRR